MGQTGFELFERRRVGNGGSLVKNLEQLKKLLGPELLVTPGAKLSSEL